MARMSPDNRDRGRKGAAWSASLLTGLFSHRTESPATLAWSAAPEVQESAAPVPAQVEGQLRLVSSSSGGGGRKRGRGSRRLLVAVSYVLSLAAVAALVGGATFGAYAS